MLTAHARERCAEMGVSTKVPKHIVQRAEVRYPGRPTADGKPTVVAMWTGDPTYVAVYLDDPQEPVRVLTLLYDSRVPYDRETKAFIS